MAAQATCDICGALGAGQALLLLGVDHKYLKGTTSLSEGPTARSSKSIPDPYSVQIRINPPSSLPGAAEPDLCESCLRRLVDESVNSWLRGKTQAL
jgi:hypothetical protein